MKCIVCNKTKFKLIWNDKLRSSAVGFTKKNEKIYQCINCDLVFLHKRRKILENSSIARNKYNKNNSIKEFLKFHTPREMKKLNFIKNKINLKNKKVLESNCGAGILISKIKQKAKITAGIDNTFYKKFLEKNGHLFFNSTNDVLKKKICFDIILSFSELEHKYNPVNFLKNLKLILSKNGKIILRIPNYFNIYMFLLGYNFLKYDFRTSHNFYFSKKNLDILFKKLGFKIIYSSGMNEYSFNHLLNYVKLKKRVRNKKIYRFLEQSDDNYVVQNLEKNWTSTSLIYILKN